MLALRMSVEGLRPWEYWGMDADEYDQVTHLQGLWRAEMAEARAADERRRERQNR